MIPKVPLAMVPKVPLGKHTGRWSPASVHGASARSSPAAHPHVDGGNKKAHGQEGRGASYLRPTTLWRAAQQLLDEQAIKLNIHSDFSSTLLSTGSHTTATASRSGTRRRTRRCGAGVTPLQTGLSYDVLFVRSSSGGPSERPGPPQQRPVF